MSADPSAVLAEIETLLSQITPGDWRSENPGRNDVHMCRITAYVDGEGASQIGLTWHPEHMVSYVGLSRQQCVDNARLMAASPRLLRSCVELIRSLQAERDELRLAIRTAVGTIAEDARLPEVVNSTITWLRRELNNQEDNRKRWRAKAEAAEAELTRLKPYVQHRVDCKRNQCVSCRHWLQGGMHVSSGATHAFEAGNCSCGLSPVTEDRNQ